jgi:hypothetical protein
VVEHRLGPCNRLATLLQIQQLLRGEPVDGEPVHLCGQRFELRQGSQHRLSAFDC